jgi:hypothetical protein
VRDQEIPTTGADPAVTWAPHLVMAGALLGPVAPRAAAGAMLLATVALVLSARRRLLDVLTPIPAVVAALLGLGAWLVVNASWSVSRAEAYGKVFFYFFVVATVWVAMAALARAEPRAMERSSSRLPLAVGAGAIFLLVEVVLDQPIARFVGTWIPLLRPDSKHAVIVDGRVVSIGEYRLNRNVAVLCLFLFPALLAARTALPTSLWRVAGVALVAVTALSVFQSEHETSMLALIFAGLTFVGMLWLPTIMRRLVLVGWITATVLVVPLALAAYEAGMHQARWIPETGRNRIILWSKTASEWRKAPLLGVGVAATRDLDLKAAPNAVRPEGHTYSLRTGRHAHNVFLQTWYELGALGASLLLIVGLAILGVIRRLPRAQAPYAYAAFVSAVITACFSWGMWQTWFIAAFAATAILLAIALDAAERREADASPPSVTP